MLLDNWHPEVGLFVPLEADATFGNDRVQIMDAKRSETTRSRKRSSGQVFQIKITLKHISPAIWRRILVRETCTLGKLHNIIQIVMGWDGGHMHAFRIPARGFGPPLRTFSDDVEDEDEDQFRLCDVFVRLKQVLIYEYDFGDGWEHQVVLEKVVPIETVKSLPLCLAGARACPPEDCGGVPGYYEILEALKNPKAPESEERLEWLGHYDPEKFHLDQVNRMLGGRRT